MALKFAWRGDQLAPRYAWGLQYAEIFNQASSAGGIQSVAGAIGGTALDLTGLTNDRAIVFPGLNNMPTAKTVSIVIGYIPNFSGTVTTSGLFDTGEGVGSYQGRIRLHRNGDNVLFSVGTEAGVVPFFSTSIITGMNAASSAGTRMDLVFTLDFSDGANSFKGFRDGSLVVTQTGASTYATAATRNPMFQPFMMFGACSDIQVGPDCYVDEILIFDHILDPSTEVPFFDGTSGRGYYTATASNIGASPTAGQLKTGEVVQTVTGTYDGSDRWTDPGESNVLTGVTYKANSLTENKTGTLDAVTIVTDSLQATLAGGPLTGELT